MLWELWDLETRNLLGDFATEEEGLTMVRGLLDANGAAAADILRFGPDDTVLGGVPLILRAYAVAAPARTG